MPTTTIYCRCAFANVIPPEIKDEHLARLCAGDAPFEAVPDLCEMAARRDPKLAEIAADASRRIIACHPRAVRGLFTQAGSPLPDTTEIVNMRAADEEAP
jgi:hypothetical protein